MRLQRPLVRILVVASLAIAAGAAGLCAWHNWPIANSSYPTPPVIRQMRAIVDALYQYHSRYDTLPYSPRGNAFALYGLREFISAESFDGACRASGNATPHWDTVQHCLENSSYWLLNSGAKQLHLRQIVLVSKPVACRKDNYVVTWGGNCIVWSMEGQPDERVLGNWVTEDNLIVINDTKLIERMDLTHLLRGKHWTTSWEDGNVVEATAEGVSYK
jgi:hypothetical protein